LVVVNFKNNGKPSALKPSVQPASANNALPFSGSNAYVTMLSLLAAQCDLGKKVSINNPCCCSSLKYG